MKISILLLLVFVISGCGSNIKKSPMVESFWGEKEANERKLNIEKAKAAGVPILINRHTLNSELFVKQVHMFSVEIDNISGKGIKSIALVLSPYKRNGERVKSQGGGFAIVKSNKFLGKPPRGTSREWRVVLEGVADCTQIKRAIVFMSDGTIKNISEEQMKLAYPSSNGTPGGCGSKY